ncbi:MAG: cytochrome c [Caulobacterales bacterium]|jgi:mono/diheme cytochrome c family protein|nr:cytochrome c [Caulobacterales bacterium]
MLHLVRILALPLLLGACAQTVTQAPNQIAANEVEGHRLAEVHCARCHAIGAEGESPHPMAPAFRTLSRDYPVNALEEAFAEGILVGHPEMPEFRFEPDQVDDLVAYIQSIQERRGG